jgi:hypothetical protein
MYFNKVTSYGVINQVLSPYLPGVQGSLQQANQEANSHLSGAKCTLALCQTWKENDTASASTFNSFREGNEKIIVTFAL